MKWLYLFCLNICALVASAQEAITKEAIQDSIINQLSFFPQEKIHLHTDRGYYSPQSQESSYRAKNSCIKDG